MHKNFKILLGIIISISLLIYLFYKIDLKKVISTLLAFNLYTLIILLLIFIIGMLLRSMRWRLLIKQRTEVNLLLIFKALSIGYMLNNLLPAKMGELARMEYLKRNNGIGRSFLLGTIFIERLLDVILVLVIFAFSIVFSQTSRHIFLHNQWVIYTLAGAIIISVYVMLNTHLMGMIIHIIPVKFKNRFANIAKAFSEAFLFIKNRKLLIEVTSLSIAIWALTLLSSFFILLGLGVTLPVYAYLFLVAAGVLGVVIPSTAGGIGVYHAISTAALLLFSVAPEKALAYAIISHAFDFFPNIILGSIILIQDRIKLKLVKEQ